MRVFVYEYVCGGALAGQLLPESLAREGWAMLASIVEDLACVEGVHVTVTLDERLLDRTIAAHCVEPMAPGDEQQLIQRLARECDWTLVIAPESDGILLDRVRWVEAACGRLLGPSSAGVAVAADKLTCAQYLERAGVPAIVGQVMRLSEGAPTDVLYPAVLKPRDGAGSQCTYLIPERASAAQVVQQALADGLRGDALFQPFVPGLAASVAFLIGSAGTVPLQAAEQLLSNDGRFRYLGGRIPLEPALASRAVALAGQAVAAVPGLHGYVGVDLVLEAGSRQSAVRSPQFPGPGVRLPTGRPLTTHDSPLHSPHDVVIEINPRLTTSYVGLRALSRSNLAEQLLRVCQGEVLTPIGWKPECVCFRADGALTWQTTPTDRS